MELNFEHPSFWFGATFIVGLVFGLTISSWKKVDLVDLVLNRDGTLSGARFWENIALAVGVWGFMYSIHNRIATEMTWLIFLGAYTGNKLVGNFLFYRYGPTTTTLPKEDAPVESPLENKEEER